MTDHKELLELFDLDSVPTGECRVTCPSVDHEDNNPSCDINFQKDVFCCRSCGYQGKLSNLLNDDSDNKPVPVKAEPIVKEASEGVTITETCELFLANRGLVSSELGVQFGIEGEYLQVIPAEGPVQGRYMGADPSMARYSTSPGSRGIFWTREPPAAGGLVWLTEGPFDALALDMAGARVAAAALGSSLSAEQAYELKNKFTIVCYDLDGAGYRGAQKTSKLLSEFNAAHVVAELPMGVGKDPGELWQVDPALTRAWVENTSLEYQPDGQQYVTSWRKLTAYNPVATGYSELDDALNGGFLPGTHVIMGETGLGKSTLVLDLARTAALRGEKSVYLSTELSRREVWARLSSGIDGAPGWAELMVDPSKLPESCHAAQAELAKHITVLQNVPADRLMQVVEQVQPDIVFVDYFQEMVTSGTDELQGQMRGLAKRLTNFSRDFELPLVLVSSMRRGADPSIDSAKYTGDIEYLATTVSGLSRSGFGERSAMHLQLFKNRCGKLATASLEFVPEYSGFRPYIKPER